jgi:hypothetical protein
VDKGPCHACRLFGPACATRCVPMEGSSAWMEWCGAFCQRHKLDVRLGADGRSGNGNAHSWWAFRRRTALFGGVDDA